MRIAFLNYHYDVDGSARGAAAQLRSMAHALERLGHRVDLVFRTARHRSSADSGKSAFNPARFPTARRFGHVPRLILRNLSFTLTECRFIREKRPDILLAVHQYCNVSPVLAARRMSIPCVLFLEAPTEYEYSLFYRDYYSYPLVGRALEGLCLRLTDEAVCVSEILKGALMRHGVPASKLHVVPNGVDERRFFPSPPEPSLLERFHLAGKRVVGFVGTFQFFSPPSQFLDAVERVRGRFPDAVFLFVGSGPTADVVKQEGAKRGMGDRLLFSGPVTHGDVPRYLSVMNVTICPYRGDYLFYGSALKPLEYMACGKAVVAPALGQIKELIHDGCNGLLYTWDNPEEMASKVISLLEDPGLRQALGASARRTIEGGWTWDIQAARMARVLEKAAASKP